MVTRLKLASARSKSPQMLRKRMISLRKRLKMHSASLRAAEPTQIYLLKMKSRSFSMSTWIMRRLLTKKLSWLKRKNKKKRMLKGESMRNHIPCFSINIHYAGITPSFCCLQRKVFLKCCQTNWPYCFCNSSRFLTSHH